MQKISLATPARTRLLATTALGLVVTLAIPSAVRANPTGGTVVGGSATITQTPGTTTVQQNSSRTVIEWEGFSIDRGETTTFVQPGADAVALNRVTGSEASMLNGTLNANGTVILVNRNGVVVGKDGAVNTRNLVLSTSDIGTDKFMAGSNHFDRPTDNPSAAVVNQGTVTLADRGIAALVGPTVANEGVIAARLGTVALGSAETFTIDLAGDGLIAFDTGTPVNRTGGSPQVSNSGTIDAAGGTVILSAGQAATVVDRAIDMTGIVTARSIGTEGGTIVLSGGEGATVVSGTLDASGATPGTKGGTVEITGGTVALTATAKVDASGSAGGGAVKVGGDRKGTGTTPRAQVTTVARGATIDASARDQGDGGTIIVWSDQKTRFDGLARARGGAAGGDGGFVETSSRGTLTIERGRVDASAALGQAGNWLLDPTDIVISNNPADAGPGVSFVSADALVASLNASTDVSIVTDDAGIGAGMITLLADLETAIGSAGGDGQATLHMEADGGISLNNGFGITNTAGLLILDLQIAETVAGGPTHDINIGDITADGGNIFLAADASFFEDDGGRVFFSGDFTSKNGGAASIYAHGNVVEVDGTIDIAALSLDDIDLAPLSLASRGLRAGAFFDAIAPAASKAGDEFDPTFVTGNVASIAVRDGADGTAGVLTIATQDLSLAVDGGGNTLAGRISAPTVVLTGAPGTGIALNPGVGAAVDGLTVFTDQLVALDFTTLDTLELGRLADTTTASLGARFDADLLGNADLVLSVFAQDQIDVGAFAGDIAAIPTAIRTGTLNLFTAGNAAAVVNIGSSLETTIIADAINIGLAPGLSAQGAPGLVTIGGTAPTNITAQTLRIGGITTNAAGEIVSLDNAVGSTEIGQGADVDMDIRDILIFSDSLTIGNATNTIIEGFNRFAASGRDGFGSAFIDATDGSFDGLTRIDGFADALFLLDYDEIGIGSGSGAGTVIVDANDIALLSRTDGTFIGSNATLTAADDFTFALGPTGELVVDGTLAGSDFTFMAYYRGQDTVVGEDDAAGRHAMYDQADFDAVAVGDNLVVTSRSVITTGAPIAGGDSAVIISFNDTTPPLTLSIETGFTTAGSFGTGNIEAGTGAQAVAVQGLDDFGFQTKAGGVATFAGTFTTTGGSIGVDGPALIDGPTSFDASGDIRFTGTIDATTAGAISTLDLVANGITLDREIGALRALDSLSATAGTVISAQAARTSGDQFYSAPRVEFAAGDYVSTNGSIHSAGAGANLIDGAVSFTAGTFVEFAGRIDGTNGAGDSLTADAQGGGASFFGNIGGVSAFDSVDIASDSGVILANVTTLANGIIRAPVVTLLGEVYDFGGTLDITGNVEALVNAQITADGALTLDGDLDIAASSDINPDLVLESETAGVEITGAVGSNRAPQNLTVSAATQIEIGNATTLENQDYTAPTVILRGDTYTAGGNVTSDGATLLDGVTTVDAGGSILFTGTIDREAGVGSLVASAGPTGDVTVRGVIGGINALGSVNLTAGDQVSAVGANTIGAQTYEGADVALAGSYDAGTSISVTGPVTIDGPVVVNAGDDVAFNGSIDAAAGPGHSLDVTAQTGSITFTLPLGAIRRLDSVTAQAGTAIETDDIETRGATSLAAPLITLTGNQYVAGSTLTFAGDITMVGDTLIEADDAVVIGGSLDGTGTDLTITSSTAAVTITGPVGGSEILDTLQVNAATTINVQDAHTASGQTYTAAGVALNGAAYRVDGGDFSVNGAATLAGPATIDTSLGSIAFSGTIDAASAAARLTAVAGSGGGILVEGLIGGLARLAALSLTADGDVVTAGARTTGDQRYNGGGIAFAGIYSSETGSILANGATVIDGAVTMTAGDSIAFDGTVNAIDAAGGGDMLAMGDDRLTATAQTGSITFTDAVGGINALSGVAANAATTLEVASIESLAVIDLEAPGILLTGNRYTAGTELKTTGAVGISQDTELTGSGAVIMIGAIDRAASASGSPNLSITSSNSGVVLRAPVGQTRALGDLTINADVDAFLADTTIDGDLVVVSPQMTFTGSNYELGGGLVISSQNTTVAQDASIDATDNILIVGTLDTHADAAGPVALRIRSSDSSVTLLGEVGVQRALASLTVNAASEIGLEAGARTTGDQSYTASTVTMGPGLYDSGRDLAINGDLMLIGEVTIDATQDLTIGGTIDSAMGDADGLRGRGTFTAGRDLIVTGAVGSGEPLSEFHLTAGRAIDPPSVITFGPQSYTAPSILLTGSLYRTNGGSFTAIGDLTLSAASVLLHTNVLTAAAGDILLDGHVEGGNVSIDAGEASITALDVSFVSLTVFHVTGSADMGGFIGSFSGSDAARAVLRPDGIADAYLFNGCVMAVGCLVPIDHGIDSTLDFELPNPPVALSIDAPPLIVAGSDAFIDDPRYVFSNTGKDALWRLDLEEPAPGEENAQ